MITLHLPDDVAASCLELALWLQGTARGEPALSRSAAFVQRCYVRAVTPAPAPAPQAHELRWRRFINALHAYLERCPDSRSSAARRLRAIVRENADLLNADEFRETIEERRIADDLDAAAFEGVARRGTRLDDQVRAR